MKLVFRAATGSFFPPDYREKDENLDCSAETHFVGKAGTESELQERVNADRQSRFAPRHLSSNENVSTIVTVMAVNTQFSIAVHIMAGLAYLRNEDTTSATLAKSVNTSPSFVRRILARLSKAGLVRTIAGKAGACWLARDPRSISLLDIYEAVNAPKVFSIHSYPEQKSCPVSCNIKGALEKALFRTQRAMEKSLGEITLAEIVSNIKKI